ncbi:MAG: mechanosensitive ion channel family protein [Alphaproteobacteria bacterium]|nr:mechanosensitive ion channel family protein [Alphaproteobacteria bacterium]
MDNVDLSMDSLEVMIDTIVEFAVAYGFQILGALVVLVIGLKISSWLARRTVDYGTRRDFDPTLTKFAGNVVRVILIAIVVIITLGNFGITIAPFIALAGAVAFGGTLAIQGPLSNYGAGLVLILTRPFKVGSTIQVQGVYGVVEEINLAATVLRGEDGETITIPNKEIVGRVLVDSHHYRVIESKIIVRNDQDIDLATDVIRDSIAEFAESEEAPPAQVGVHDFTYGGVVLGARFWVPSLRYFQIRYLANRKIHSALKKAGITFVEPASAAVLGPTDASPVESTGGGD